MGNNLMNFSIYDNISLHNKYVVIWSELENSSHIVLYLCVLFILGENMENFFEIAYKEALKAYKRNEIPVGAVIVKNGKIIAKSSNNRQKNNDILGHAEINCIKKAAKKQKDWRLDDYELYVTLEPCNMCNAIIEETRISKVYFLIKQENLSKKTSKTPKTQTNDCNKLKEEYILLLKSFFNKLRNKL